MNGGNPGIQTWTNRYKVTVAVIQALLNSPDYTAKITPGDTEFYPEELIEVGVIEKIAPKTYKLNIDALKQHSMVIPDDYYQNFLDINWLREQRKQLGQIKGRVKDEEFRRKQQARRKQRRNYAKEQKAKRLAQPPEELPLHEVIFPD